MRDHRVVFAVLKYLHPCLWHFVFHDPRLADWQQVVLLSPNHPDSTVSDDLLPSGAEVAVQVSTEYRAVLTVDGQGETTLADGDTVTVTGGDRESLFVRTHSRDYFYHSLMERLR